MNFINLSNHPSSGWGEEQKQAAKQWGTIIDYPFPEVNAQSSTQNIKELAEIIVIRQIIHILFGEAILLL